MLTAHVEEQVNSKTATDCKVSEVKLTCCQFGLLGLKLLITPLVRLLAGNLKLVLNTQLLQSALNVGVIETKDVVAAQNVRIALPDLLCELEKHICLIVARHKVHVWIIGLCAFTENKDSSGSWGDHVC